MDFHSLPRRELQALCKRNKIQANLTNVAMADALKALQTVEGLEELLNPSESQNSQSPEKSEIGSPEVPRTCRTSTRRKVIKAVEEPESSQTVTRTRRGTRRIEVNQEKSEAVQTPAVTSSRKGVPAASTLQRTTRAEQKSVQHAYSTRRSARLSEKLGRTPMEVEFSKVMTKDLVEDGENKEVESSKVMTKVSVEKEENKESDLKTISEESSKITHDLEAATDEISIEVSSDYRAKTGDSSDCIEGSEATSKSSKIPDSEIGKDLLPVQHDSKAEVGVKAEESAKLDELDFHEVSEAKDKEGLDEQNKEADTHENSEVDYEKMDESKSLKVSVHLNDEIEQVTNIEDMNEFTEMENEQQRQLVGSDPSVPPQADNSSSDSEKPELILPATLADEVASQNPVIEDSELNLNNEAGFGQVDHGKAIDIRPDIAAPPPQTTVDDDSSCESEKQELSFSLTSNSPDEIVESQNPVSMDSAMSVTSEESNDDEDGEVADQGDDDDGEAADQGDVDEFFDMDLYQKEAADLPGLDLADDSSSDSEKPELSLNSWIETGSDSSIDVDQTESQVKLEFSNRGSMDLEDVTPPSGKPESEENEAENGTEAEESLPFLKSFPTPVKVMMSPHRPKSNTAVSGRTPLSPLAAGSQLPGQAISTPTRKSSSKKAPPSSAAAAQKMMILISDNKENLDSSSGMKKIVVVKPEMGKKKSTGGVGVDIKRKKKLTDTSLRQLRKMFKEKLQIKENADKSSTEDYSDEVMRPGLQTHCHMAKVETGSQN